MAAESSERYNIQQNFEDSSLRDIQSAQAERDVNQIQIGCVVYNVKNVIIPREDPGDEREETFSSEDLEPLRGWKKLLNYLRVIFLLFRVFLVWSYRGFFAKQPFPSFYAKLLLEYAIRGLIEEPNRPTDKLCEEAERRRLELHDYSRTAREDSKAEAARLCELDSKYWLHTKLYEILFQNSKDLEKSLRIFDKISAHRYRITKELDPLKKKYYPNLKADLQLEEESLLFSGIFRDLIENYAPNNINNYPPSIVTMRGILQDLKQEVDDKSLLEMNPLYTITLQRIYLLLNWFSLTRLSFESHIVARTDAKSKSDKKVYHFEESCESYPTKHDQTREFKSYVEASECGFQPCSKCIRELSNSVEVSVAHLKGSTKNMQACNAAELIDRFRILTNTLRKQEHKISILKDLRFLTDIFQNRLTSSMQKIGRETIKSIGNIVKEIHEDEVLLKYESSIEEKQDILLKILELLN